MLWGLDSYPDFVTDMLLDKGLVSEFDRLFRMSKNRKLAFGSYISAPRSTDVVNALAWHCARMRRPTATPTAASGKRDCDDMASITDCQLFFDLLAPGERSDVFSSRSKIVKEHYLNTLSISST